MQIERNIYLTLHTNINPTMTTENLLLVLCSKSSVSYQHDLCDLSYAPGGRLLLRRQGFS